MHIDELLKFVWSVSTQTSMPAYVVGGFVRDQMLFGNTGPRKDIDIVVVGDAVVFAEAFDELLEKRGSLVLFADFGTARYVLPVGDGQENIEIEFATARNERYDRTSRKPQVSKATLEEDLARRDFTVNSMARAITDSGLGTIIDPYGGEKDLAAKVLKTPLNPEETFFDDPLRMMRAARFAAQLGFTIAPEVLAAMARNAERLKIISAERIQEELLKLLAAQMPSVGLWILYHSGLMREFLPEICALAGVEEVFGYSHKDNLSHSFAVVDNIAIQSKNVWLRFAGLVHDVGKPETKQFTQGRGWTFDMHEHVGKKIVLSICRRLRISKHMTQYLTKLVRWHLQPIALMDEGITDSAVRRLMVNVGDDLDELLILCRSDITTGNQKKKAHRLSNYDRLEERIAAVREKDTMRAFQSPVRGDEIMKLLGLHPGPTVGKIKKAIEQAILDGKIPNEYEAARNYFDEIKDEYLASVAPWEKI